MKTWFAKLRISVALDEGKPLPVSEDQAKVPAGEVQQFTLEAQALDRALRQARPPLQAPSSLHGSIMRAVRADAPGVIHCPDSMPHSALRTAHSWWHWVPVPAALAVVVLLGCWWLRQPTASSPPALSAHSPDSRARLHSQDSAASLATAGRALQVGEQVKQAVPGMVSPLSEELQRLSQDLNATAQFLQASLP